MDKNKMVPVLIFVLTVLLGIGVLVTAYFMQRQTAPTAPTGIEAGTPYCESATVEIRDYHLVCSALGTCEVVSGPGSNDCSVATQLEDCNRYACDNSVCTLVPGTGEDLCDPNNDNCGTSHSICTADGACVETPGTGENECGSDTDCDVVEVGGPPEAATTATHSVCRNKACVLVSGSGLDECKTNSDCITATTTLDQESQPLVPETGPVSTVYMYAAASFVLLLAGVTILIRGAL